MNLDKVKAADIDVANYIEEELKRQQTTIELIASELYLSGCNAGLRKRSYK